MPEPAPVDPEVAAALLRSHLEDFFENSPRVRGGAGWSYVITENPLIAIVGIPARMPDSYTLRLDGRCYDTWPVSATFVEAHGGGWRRARFGSLAFPLLRGSPGAPPGDGVGFQFALHDEYPFPGESPDQLICFSYNLSYYTSNHTPAENQKWRPGEDRVDATLSRIHAALTSPAYLGPSGAAGAP
ncbi:hypothetical protein [Amycolatopsis sp. NPDC049159]|uniref:hypothetical protein n=1 Tax=Amycolatopsis sp. NPDC049159 TaxID=3157210 RepID=UPI0033CC1933